MPVAPPVAPPAPARPWNRALILVLLGVTAIAAAATVYVARLDADPATLLLFGSEPGHRLVTLGWLATGLCLLAVCIAGCVEFARGSRGTGLYLVIGVGLVGGVLIPMIGGFVAYIASFHGPWYTVPPGLDDRDYDVVVQNNFRYGHEDFVYQVYYGGPVTFERLGVLTARLDECTGRCIPTVETAADGTQSLILAGDRVELP
ncbi:hypothetical protein GCM10017772_00170 [Promicromonospora soli]|uniref:Uncharacterized protein n=2 Tax=Promicromonospora soli TaxID=2035533 RepID=A0A919KM79_9MICO|nr:hypothetical protein GCM10017772_00170 [Promicromonospora soli]